MKELVPFIDESVIIGGFYTPTVAVADSLRAGTLMRERAQEAGALTVSPNNEVIDIDLDRRRVKRVRTARGDVEAEPVADFARARVGLGTVHVAGLSWLARASNPRLGRCMTEIPGFNLDEFVQRVLAEDLGTGGDVTSKATISEEARFKAEMNCREPIVVAGLDIAIGFFRELDPQMQIEKLVCDGAKAEAGAVLLRLEGKARQMLTAERSALNTLQHLSGIATLTRHYVDKIAGTVSTLLDTRKTTPGLRVLENMRRGWAGPRTTACGSTTAC